MNPSDSDSLPCVPLPSSLPSSPPIPSPPPLPRTSVFRLPFPSLRAPRMVLRSPTLAAGGRRAPPPEPPKSWASRRRRPRALLLLLMLRPPAHASRFSVGAATGRAAVHSRTRSAGRGEEAGVPRGEGGLGDHTRLPSPKRRAGLNQARRSKRRIARRSPAPEARPPDARVRG